MDGRNSIGAVRTDNGEVCHANLTRRFFLHEADPFDTPFLSGKAHANFVEKPAIGLVDDLQLPGKQRFEPRDRPFLERLGK